MVLLSKQGESDLIKCSSNHFTSKPAVKTKAAITSYEKGLGFNELLLRKKKDFFFFSKA